MLPAWKSDKHNNVQSGSDPVSELSDSPDTDFWPYDKGSDQEKEALEVLIVGLNTMRTVAGLCKTENKMLDQATAFMERELGE